MSEVLDQPADTAAAAPAAPAAAPAPAAPAPAPASVLAQGAAAAPAAAPSAQAPAAAPEEFKFADKVMVSRDGITDWEATARQAEQARQHLERRMGAGEAPPKEPTEYKVNIPEALKDKVNADELAKTDDFKQFLTDLHASGASQKVVDVAVATMLQRGIAMREAMPVLQAADCEAELRKAPGWGSDVEYSARVADAFKAGKTIFGADFDGIVARYGNDPALIRGLAGIANEMQEDRQASPEAQAQVQESLDQLMAQPAYLNANHPQHMATRAKVDALTARIAGNRPVASGRTHSFKSG